MFTFIFIPAASKKEVHERKVCAMADMIGEDNIFFPIITSGPGLITAVTTRNTDMQKRIQYNDRASYLCQSLMYGDCILTVVQNIHGTWNPYDFTYNDFINLLYYRQEMRTSVTRAFSPYEDYGKQHTYLPPIESNLTNRIYSNKLPEPAFDSPTLRQTRLSEQYNTPPFSPSNNALPPLYNGVTDINNPYYDQYSTRNSIQFDKLLDFSPNRNSFSVDRASIQFEDIFRDLDSDNNRCSKPFLPQITGNAQSV